MNKFFTIAILAGGLLLLDSPQAAADDELRDRYASRDYQRARSYDRDEVRRDSYYRDLYRRDGRDYRHGNRDRHHKYSRRSKMPHWLHHEKSFRRWYQHTSLRYNRYLSWHELFEIYRWENSRHRYYRY